MVAIERTGLTLAHGGTPQGLGEFMACEGDHATLLVIRSTLQHRAAHHDGSVSKHQHHRCNDEGTHQAALGPLRAGVDDERAGSGAAHPGQLAAVCVTVDAHRTEQGQLLAGLEDPLVHRHVVTRMAKALGCPLEDLRRCVPGEGPPSVEEDVGFEVN